MFLSVSTIKGRLDSPIPIRKGPLGEADGDIPGLSSVSGSPALRTGPFRHLRVQKQRNRLSTAASLQEGSFTPRTSAPLSSWKRVEGG